MSLVINHNSMASRAARSLSNAYNQLSTSTSRLSSGLRINSAADDAAGLSIREMMRSDVRVINQGVRNANDAISLIQTADGALQIIDEKLIRMKELSEQAATGTYTSTQRLVIDSEFQAMASEINRIAYATDFNGIKLLDGSRAGIMDFDPESPLDLETVRQYLFGDTVPRDVKDYKKTISYDELIEMRGGYSKIHDGSGAESKGAIKVHFGTGNDSAEDYYYVDIGAATTKSLLGEYELNYSRTSVEWAGAVVDDTSVTFRINSSFAGNAGNAASVGGDMPGMDFYALPVGLKNVTIRSKGYAGAAHKPDVNLFTRDGTQLTGVDPEGTGFNGIPGSLWWDGKPRADVIQAGVGHGLFDPGAAYKNNIHTTPGSVISAGDTTITMETGQNNNSGDWETIHIDEITSDLVFLIGGHANNRCNQYDLEITAELDETVSLKPIENHIRTQDKAQNMLVKLDDALVKKENVRAHLGAMQNRLENTVTNLQVQSDNLQAAESQISDVDVATEMTQFVRSQVLAQSAIAMLSQANNLPKMVMQLIEK